MQKILFLTVLIFTSEHIAQSGDKRRRDESAGVQLALIKKPRSPKDSAIQTPIVHAPVVSPKLPVVPTPVSVVLQRFFPTFPGVPGCLYMDMGDDKIPAKDALGLPLVGRTQTPHEIRVLSEVKFSNGESMIIVPGMICEDRVLGDYFAVYIHKSDSKKRLVKLPKNSEDRLDLFELKQ